VRSRQVVCLIALAVLGAACTSGTTISTTTSVPTTTSTTVPRHPTPTIAVDLSATPAGWVPVAYGDAQISVPAAFAVVYRANGLCQIEMPAGVIVVGAPVRYYGCEGTRTSYLDPTLMSIRFEGTLGGTDSEAHKTINGITVFTTPDRVRVNAIFLSNYEVPSLGVEISAGGYLARRVLATLTRSPRTVALESSPAPAIPPGWHAVTFRGLTFDSPPSWTVTRTAVTGKDVGRPCSPSGVSFITTEVAFSTDRQPFPIAFCPILLYQRPQPPDDGVEVDAGGTFQFPVPLSFSAPCLHLHSLTVCPATSPDYSILFLKVTVPGHATPVIVSIGLAGNGTVARTILYSLRAA